MAPLKQSKISEYILMPRTNGNNKIVEKELSYKLGGIFFDVQKKLGRFCRERQYADAIENELRKNNLEFAREHPIPLEGRKSNFADFIIENRILVDLKAKPFIEKSDYYQMKRYLEISNLELGLVVNFSQRYLNPKRVLNSKSSKYLKHSDKFVVSDRAKDKPLKHSDKFVVSDRAKGYTLIELLVSIGIFLIIVTIAVGGFVRALNTQKQATSLMAVNTNVASTIELMAREIRTGTNFSSLSPEVLNFVNTSGESVSYALVGEAIEKDGSKITDDNVSVRYLNFQVFNIVDYPSRINISLGVSPKERGVEFGVINIQTTISSRNF
ncbi:MAG: GxxExxY protein [bacterium]|nr:GxxExxY protein [bacterium]